MCNNKVLVPCQIFPPDDDYYSYFTNIDSYSLQSKMIGLGLLPWVVTVLQHHDTLSDYTLHYSLALLMNLVLRTSGQHNDDGLVCVLLCGCLILSGSCGFHGC